MSNIHIKVISLILISLILINSSTCVLNKIDTKIYVFGEYESEIQRLDISAKLSYINMDSGETRAVPGQNMNIILNITKNSGEYEEIKREVMTNSGGWAKRTFYLEDVKSYDVKVIYDGNGAYKNAIGTLSGSGDYEQVSYVTSLPEGISLVTCMPLLLLFGFLGAAMYASGGNPFGFVDLTTSRGFRMNRNIRKSMFTQVGGWVIGSTVASAAKRVISELSKDKEVEGKGEKGENKEGKKEEGTKIPEKIDLKKGGVWNFKRSKRVDFPVSVPKDSSNAKTISLKSDVVSENVGGKNLFIKTRGKAFHVIASMSLALLSFLSGESFNPRSTREISKNSRNKIISKHEKIQRENTSLKVKEQKINEDLIKLKEVQDANNINSAEILKKIDTIKDKLKNERGKLTGKIPDDIQTLRNIRLLRKNLRSLNKDRKQALETNNNHNKQIENAGKQLTKITELTKKLSGEATINSLSALYNDKKDSFSKEEMKKINKEMESVMNTNILSERDGKLYNKIKKTEIEKKIIDKEIEELNKNSGQNKEKIKEKEKEKSILEENKFLFTEAQQIANYIEKNEKIDDAVKQIFKMEEEKKEAIKESQRATKIIVEQEKQIYEDLKTINYLVNNDEKREELEKIIKKVQNKETLTKKEEKEVEKYNVMFDEERQFKALYAVSSTNIYQEKESKPMTIEKLIEQRENIKKEIGEEITKIVRESQEKNIVMPKEDLKKVEILRKESEKIAEASIDLTYQIYEGEQRIRAAKEGKYNAYEIVNNLNPNRDTFSNEYEKYKKAYNAENKYIETRKSMGLEYDKEHSEIKNEEERLSYKLYNNIHKEEMEYEKGKKEIDETVKKYNIMSEIDTENKLDANGVIGKRLKENLNFEINKLDKEIKTESSTAFSTRDENASLGELKGRKKELEELEGEISSVLTHKERENFFKSKSKTNTMKKNEEGPRK